MGRSPLQVAPAPWRAAFVAHLETLDSPTFVLSSVHLVPSVGKALSGRLDAAPEKEAEAESGAAAAAAWTPRARTVVYRGMWAGLTANPRNPAPRNPNSYKTDLLTITTDVRMEKVSEMFGSCGTAQGTDSAPQSPPPLQQAPQSRVGGPVECVLWVPQAKTQWRIRGRIYMIGPDIELDAALPVREAVGAHMRRQRDGNTETTAGAVVTTQAETWSWATELTAHFGNLSPLMRGSFRNPPPGTPISQAPSPGLGLGQKVDDVHDEIARENFRVLVIVPEEVDQVDLSDPERARRWVHHLVRNGSEAAWTTAELWP